MLIIFFGIVSAIVLLCLSSNTSSLLFIPHITPENFLSSMPHTNITILGRELILIQSSSTFFVYFLGVIMIVLGIYFLVTRNKQKSRYYWAIGLILWGISAIVAGTSYQAFGYELKCRGQDLCLFTSNFELVYMLLTAYAINFLVAATGFTSLYQSGGKWLINFAILDSLAYSVYMIIGAIIPVKFLISYEGFMAFIGVNFVLMFILNIRHYIKFKDLLNRNLIIIWIGFLLVNIGYFLYLFMGVSAPLYEIHGIWFNENDVLHILLILWTVMIFFLLKNHLLDSHPKEL